MSASTRRYAPERVAAINAVLALFDTGSERSRGLRLELRETRTPLYLVSKHHAMAVRIRRDGNWLLGPTWRVGIGGTEVQAITQLVHVLRGEPRHGRAYWGSCAQHGLGERTPLLDALEAAGVFDDAATRCVLCGHASPTDWWSLDGVTGPCCRGGRCRTDRT